MSLYNSLLSCEWVTAAILPMCIERVILFYIVA